MEKSNIPLVGDLEEENRVIEVEAVFKEMTENFP